MATVTVQGKEYPIPDNFKQMSETERQNYIMQMIQADRRAQIATQTQDDIKQMKADDPSFADYVKGISRAGPGQGLLFGFGDEAEAGLRTGFGLFGDYDKKVGEIRDDIAEFQKQAPGVSIGSEITGAILPTILAAAVTAPAGGSGGVATSAGTAARIASRVPNFLKVNPAASSSGLKGVATQGAKGGAIYGGAYGMGTAESDADATLMQNIYDRAMGTLKGVAIGGATGGVAAPSINLAGRGLSKGLDTLKNFSNKQSSIDDIAVSKIAEKVAQDGLDTDLAKTTNLALASGNKGTINPVEMTLADAGENLQNLGFASKAIANAQKNKVVQQLDDRQANSAERIMTNMHDAAKTDPTKLSIDFIDDLARLVNRDSGPAYKAAYEKTIPAEKFRTILMNEPQRDVLLDAAKRGQSIMNAKGIDVPNLANMFRKDSNLFFGSADDILAQDLPTQFYHAIKKGFDDIIDEGTTILPNMQKKYTEKASAVIDLKNKFNQIIKDNNPAYAAANKQFADKARLGEAFILGNKVKNMDIRQITKKYNEMSPGEQQAFKQGVMSHFQKLSESVTEGTNFGARILGNKKNEQLFRLIMPGKNADDFKKYINTEKLATDTRNKINMNSRTAERSQSIKDLEGGVMGEFANAPQTLMGIVTELGRKGLQYTQTGGAAKADAIAKRLFETDPKQQQIILNEIKKQSEKMAAEVAKRLKRSQTSAEVLGGPVATGVFADPNNR